jgi:hypothetical protein
VSIIVIHVTHRFLRVSVRAARESTTARLQKESVALSVVQEEEREDARLALHTRLFTGYMGTLLDSCLLALRRMCYLLKLLYVGKARRTHVTHSINTSSAALALARGVSHEGEEEAEVVVSPAEVMRYMKGHNTNALVAGWLDMEGLVCQQMLAHLMEPDVAEISDEHKTMGGRRGSQGGKVGFALIEERLQEEEESGGLKALIFTPSASHAAPIFRRVVLYSSLAAKIVSENHLDDTHTAQLSARTASHTGRQAATTLSAYDPSSGHAILAVIDAFLENELLPVIQSTVNATLRELQLSNEYFSIQSILDALPGGVEKEDEEEEEDEMEIRATPNHGRTQATTPDAKEDAVLCRAAEMCLGAAKPLFSYWLQLHHNRPMVHTHTYTYIHIYIHI